MHSYVCDMVQVWWSEDSLENRFSLWILGIELKSPGLVAVSFTHQAISLALDNSILKTLPVTYKASYQLWSQSDVGLRCEDSPPPFCAGFCLEISDLQFPTLKNGNNDTHYLKLSPENKREPEEHLFHRQTMCNSCRYSFIKIIVSTTSVYSLLL